MLYIHIGVAGNLTNTLLGKELKERGRIEALKKRKAEADATNSKVAIFKRFGKLLSGALASAGKYYLCLEACNLVYQAAMQDMEKKQYIQRNRLSKTSKVTDT